MAGNPKYQGEKIIKDYGKLSFDYVPEVLVHREAQLQRLQTIFKPVLHGVRRTALLLGSVGTGKTVTAKRFCQNITSEGTLAGINITSLLINCREKRSEHAVLHAINSFFNPGCPDRGLAPEEFLRSIRRSLEERKLHMIIVLDEADEILDKLATETDEATLKQYYTRLNEIYLTDVPSFGLMYRPDMFYTVNESVWTGYPMQDDESNIPPTDCTDGYGIAALYNLELVEG